MSAVNMSFTYIKFESPNSEAQKEQPSKLRIWFEHFCEEYLPHVIPRANPDFDNLIDKVTFWLLEINKEGIPIREVGLGSSGKPLMIMPWNDNYGYWSDNNLKLSDLKNLFSISELTEVEFQNYWYEFGNLGCQTCFHAEINRFINQRTWLEFDLELTKKLGKGDMKHVITVHDGIPDKDGEFTIYECSNCETKWKLKEPDERGNGYFNIN
ncbi:MAG: hypothetical protein KI791_01805 [Cyclobacteriaceae bacterium]|nr:hypothetical protein [Cyclobacteriaceae bacterium SS2]